MYFDDDKNLMFNGQDLTADMNMWVNAYTRSNYKSFGFIFANALDKYSSDKKNKSFLL